ncbi:MAG TPA: response regulator [Candidatus Rifleibacterium sp.]|nr:response regulator [Candidatus Rifleibacterium sp.]
MTKFSLLFADPDKNVHDGHRRMIKALKPDWSLMFAVTAREAMSKIVILRPAVIISELNMELEDGSDLLQTVQKAYPEVIRIVLSSEPDGESEVVLRATQSAHRFLAKPCKGEVLVGQIERAGSLRRLLNSRELITIIGGIPYLPSLPAIYHELVAAIASPLTPLSEIGDIIARDVSMTGRVLHLVNSAFFGLPRKVSNPQTAVVMLGINVIKSLVCYVKLFFAAPDVILPGLSLDQMWSHSSQVARLSKEIAASCNASAAVQEEAFLAGMLHDVGKLLLLDHPAYYHKVMKPLAGVSEKTFSDAEYRTFGTSHAEIGAYLLGLWGLSDQVVEAVACHHRPAQLQFESSVVLRATHLANALLCMAADEAFSIDPAIMADATVKKFFDSWQKRAAHIYRESSNETKNTAGR